jgi:CIC family chloride channel protein
VQRLLEELRFRASSADALPQLSLVAVVVGLLAAGTIVLFRLAVEWIQASFLPGHQPENYEGLDWPIRLLLPASGGLIVGLLLQLTATAPSVVGVVHVMERLALHQGRMTWRPALLQFIGAALCITVGSP